MVFKVKVKYAEGSPVKEQIIAVTQNVRIRTARDAEKHCLDNLHDMHPETRSLFPCVDAQAVSDDPVDESLAPRKVASLQPKPKAAGGDA